MSRSIRCDICGNVYDYELHGLAIMEKDQVTEELTSWSERRRVDLHYRKERNCAIVADICDKCREKIIHDIREMASKQFKAEITEFLEENLCEPEAVE